VDALCPNCRNPIKGNSAVCIYCQAPLKKAESPAGRRRSGSGFSKIVFILIAIILFTQIPKITQLFFNRSEPNQKRPTHQRTRSSKELQAGGYVDENTGIDAYRNLEKAIQRSDKEQARKYVTNKRWKELELEPNEPNAITELNAGCPVETEFKVHDKNDRTVLIAKGKSELVKDNQGNPALKALIVKLAKEDGQWKVFSLECHHMPPTNYQEDALKFLDEQSATVGQDLESKLQAEGLTYGKRSCFVAIDEGNLLALKRCLSVGWNPNEADDHNYRPIDAAIHNISRSTAADREILMTLINAGVDMNTIGINGMTPLMMAATNCKQDIAKDLIQAKADLNIKNADGITALQMAKDCPEISKLLAFAGAH
jgi:Ankyrin repeats (3 copies)